MPTKTSAFGKTRRCSGDDMTTVRRITALLALVFSASAQPQRQGPDCGPINFTATASGALAALNNLNGACFNWTMSYSSTGFSGVSIQFESAPDNAGVAGAFVAFAGTLLTGANPSTLTTSNVSSFLGYYPWLRINVTSVTGSGLITGQIYGYRH